jgi:hypothetical protein
MWPPDVGLDDGLGDADREEVVVPGVERAVLLQDAFDTVEREILDVAEAGD